MLVVGFSFVANVKGSMDLQIEREREESGKLIVSLAATIKLFWLCLSANCATKVLRLLRKQLTTMAGSGSKLQQEAACNRETCSIINKALSRAHNFIRCPFASSQFAILCCAVWPNGKFYQSQCKVVALTPLEQTK